MASVSVSVYEYVGGEAFFHRLVDRFYDRVEQEPLLRPMYPENLRDAREHLALFLIQYFGGPREYERRRGHPRLRMRHLPFVIGAAERDAWLRAMLSALESEPPPDPAGDVLRDYFIHAAAFLVNRSGE